MKHSRAGVSLVLLAACGGASSQKGTVGSTPPDPYASAAPLASSTASASASTGTPIVPVPPPAAPAPVTQLAARGDVTCARHADGAVRCWGDNRFNVISNQHSSLGHSSIRRPQLIADLPPAAEVVLGEAWACARLADATVRCWGTDDGDLGLGTALPGGPPPHTDAPMPVLGLSGVVSLSGFGHLCALLENKSVTCWADYDRGFGDPRDAGSRAPVVVPGFAGALQISDGGNLSCARFATSVKCWSDVSPGLIPKGKVRADPYPIAVANVASIASSDAGGCAITTTGTVSCWGNMPFTSNGPASTTVARAIPGLRDVVALSVGNDLACAVTKTGDVLCDASDYAKPHAPTKVAGVSGAVEVVVGGSHACARTAAGAVSCWGRNDAGQLGDAASSDRATAAPVVW